jgi:hypothetical protein
VAAPNTVVYARAQLQCVRRTIKRCSVSYDTPSVGTDNKQTSRSIAETGARYVDCLTEDPAHHTKEHYDESTYPMGSLTEPVCRNSFPLECQWTLL